jgi:hypothetical protein
MENGAIVAMLVAILGYAVPSAFFDTSEAIPTLRRERATPGRGWLGPALAIGFGLVAVISFEVWIYESLREMPRNASLVVFLGAALFGAGVGGFASGHTSFGAGSRWFAPRVYTFFDPRRVRKVALIRAVLGMALLAWVSATVAG